MSLRRARSSRLAMVLAFLAVMVIGGLSGWHGASFHGDEPVHAMSFEHVHASGAERGAATDPEADPKMAIHLAAHAVGQGIALPTAAAAPYIHPLVAMAWPLCLSLAGSGLDPASLLRPPQG